MGNICNSHLSELDGIIAHLYGLTSDTYWGRCPRTMEIEAEFHCTEDTKWRPTIQLQQT